MASETKRMLIVGATSRLAMETARLYAREGWMLALAGRNERHLDQVARELEREGGIVAACRQLDVSDASRRHQAVQEMVEALGGLDVALLACGVAHRPEDYERDWGLVAGEVETNFTGLASLLLQLANYCQRQGRGTLAVIGSVAGDRGRRDQYLYAATKAALHVFAQGLRQRLHPSKVAVVMVKPSLADTPMTAHLKTGLRGRLFSDPRRVAAGIRRAIDRRCSVVYVPWFWRWIMLAIRLIPEPVFKRLRVALPAQDPPVAPSPMETHGENV